MELVALSGGVCPLVLAFSCSVVAAQLCQFSIFRLCYRFTSLFLTSTSAPSLSFLVLLTCSLFIKKLPLALTLWSSASLCFEPVFFLPSAFCPGRGWMNGWVFYGLAHLSTPWPLNSPLLCCSARGQLQDHSPLWSLNNALNPNQ